SVDCRARTRGSRFAHAAIFAAEASREWSSTRSNSRSVIVCASTELTLSSRKRSALCTGMTTETSGSPMTGYALVAATDARVFESKARHLARIVLVAAVEDDRLPHHVLHRGEVRMPERLPLRQQDQRVRAAAGVVLVLHQRETAVLEPFGAQFAARGRHGLRIVG